MTFDFILFDLMQANSILIGIDIDVELYERSCLNRIENAEHHYTHVAKCQADIIRNINLDTGQNR